MGQYVREAMGDVGLRSGEGEKERDRVGNAVNVRNGTDGVTLVRHARQWQWVVLRGSEVLVIWMCPHEQLPEQSMTGDRVRDECDLRRD